MSYSILYKSMFIKTKRGFIPMLQSGDNNVFEAYSRKRVRSWCNLSFKDRNIFLTRDEILAHIEEWNKSYKEKLARDLASDDEWRKSGGSFGFYEALAVEGHHTTGTTFSNVKNLIMSGEKFAVSLEYAISKLGLHINYYVKVEGSEFDRKEKIYIKSEDEFWDAIDNQLNGKEFYIHYNESSADNFYDLQKAVSGLLSNRMGRKPRYNYGQHKDYIIECRKHDEEGLNWYVKADGNILSLTQNIKEAHIFNKQKAGKLNVSDIIFNIFRDEVRALHFNYEFQKTIDNLAA